MRHEIRILLFAAAPKDHLVIINLEFFEFFEPFYVERFPSDVMNFPRFFINKVMMRSNFGVVDNPIRSEGQSPQESVFSERFEGIVHRRLRNIWADPTYSLEYLFRAWMRIRIEYIPCYGQAVRRRSNACLNETLVNHVFRMILKNLKIKELN